MARFRNIPELGNARPGRCENETGALHAAFPQGQNGVGHGVPGQRQAKVDALPHRHGKTPAAHRLDLLAIDGDEFTLDLAGIDRETGRGCAVDDPQADARSALHLDNLWIIQRAIVGEVGVVFDVVEIHGADATMHTASRR